MRTCLAAAGDLQRATQIPDDLLEHASLLHCEGYCLYRPELPEGLFKKARSRGAIVSLDLASMEIVRSRWDMILRLLSQGLVDILFCNDQEAATVCQVSGGPTCRCVWQAGRTYIRIRSYYTLFCSLALLQTRWLVSVQRLMGRMKFKNQGPLPL